MSKVLMFLLIGAIAVPATVSAAALDEQLKMANSLSTKDQKTLAREAGFNGDNTRDTGRDQQGSQQSKPSVEPFDVELLSEPSSIERSMHDRLNRFASFVENIRQSRDTDARESRDTDARESRDTDTRESRDADTRESRDADTRESRDADTRESRDADTRESRDADTRESRDADNEYINIDDRLQSAWKGELESQPQRKVNLTERKRLQTVWNDELNEAMTKVKVSNELLQYGYNLFAGTPTTFEPASEIPIPPEYILGPGDEISVQLYGSRDDSLELVVDREGVIELPPIGPLSVAGQSFMQVKALIAEKIHQHIIGATGSVSMGRLRSMRVFVLGDVNNPGSYLVSGLSTISNALFVSGGISKKGSLRHVVLKRSGKNVAELDLYDFLLKGDSQHDVRLQPGDVVFVPPIGQVIGVAGEVVRPGIYELKKGRSYRTSDVLKLAGGTLATADVRHVQIDRITKAGNSSLLDLDLTVKKADLTKDGDLMLVYPVPGIKQDLVHLGGHVKRPGAFGLKDDMHLSDLIASEADLLPSAFRDYLIIQRANPLSGEITILQPPLGEMLHSGFQSENPLLLAGDKIFVLSNKAMRQMASVTIQGAIQYEGEYPLGKNMRIADLLMAAGGPKEEAYLKQAELTRYEVNQDDVRKTKHVVVNLAEALSGDAKANVVLLPDDVLMVRSISNWRPSEQVELKGEVKFPGVYTIENGETIEQLLQRAGGLTDSAYVQAAIFTRESIKEEQSKQMKEAATRLQREIAQMETAYSSINDPKILAEKQRGLSSAENVLEALLDLKPQGRLLIDMDNKGKLRAGSTLKLIDGDTLLIPKRPDQVMVMGEVYNQTAMLYRQNMDKDDLIDLAGGMTAMADNSRAYIIRANGYVESGSGWRSNSEIYPGDTVVVPQKLETFNALDSALDWSKVLMQTAIFTASMVALGVL
ncbi:SLBB domain-containing protein [Mariprofundus sp. NF]|uniref:SLBB domain-containing protein n=1 Tax=Mariprofundus sp. NF TaxID=2608716 RepID=UPI0015A38AED|nr:SLBB domain-containing protein [Mariprofundus sp. NF]